MARIGMEKESAKEERMEKDILNASVAKDTEYAGVSLEDLEEGFIEGDKLETKESHVRGIGMAIW